MPSNPALPEDVRAELRDKIENLPDAFSGTIVDAIAPLIIEWATEQAAQVAERMGAGWAHSSVSYRTMREISVAIRAQFTDETTGGTTK